MNSYLTTLQNVINILSGFLTPLIAIIAVGIAFVQWRTQKYKVKIDLFERRMMIFETIRNSLITVGNNASTQKINWPDYNFACRQSQFLPI